MAANGSGIGAAVLATLGGMVVVFILPLTLLSSEESSALSGVMAGFSTDASMFSGDSFSCLVMGVSFRFCGS